MTQPDESRSRTEQKRSRSAECLVQDRGEEGEGGGDALAPQAEYVHVISGDSLAAQETGLKFLKELHNKRLRQHGPEPSQMCFACYHYGNSPRHQENCLVARLLSPIYSIGGERA